MELGCDADAKLGFHMESTNRDWRPTQSGGELARARRIRCLDGQPHKTKDVSHMFLTKIPSVGALNRAWRRGQRRAEKTWRRDQRDAERERRAAAKQDAEQAGWDGALKLAGLRNAGLLTVHGELEDEAGGGL
jgi:hypothetical protein